MRSTLVVLVLGLVAFGAWLALPSRTLVAEDTSDVRVLPDFDPESIVGLAIAQDGNELVLERTGGGWGVSVWDGYPVDGARAERLLVELADLRVIEERTDNPEFHERLGLDDAGTRFRLVNDQGEVVVDVIAGRFIEGRGMIGRVVRRSGDDRVYW